MKKQSWHTGPDPYAPDPDNPSKSQVKRELIDLQEFGLRLLDIPKDRFARLEMDDRLREAVDDLRRLASSARRRQAQYVGKLLRNLDLEPFRRALPQDKR